MLPEMVMQEKKKCDIFSLKIVRIMASEPGARSGEGQSLLHV